MNDAVVYEITVVVAPELVARYEDFMRNRHIPDLLATNYFRAAAMMRDDAGRYRICYEAHSRQALDDYLSRDAARLRADFLAHFPAGVALSREIWTVLQSYTKA